MACPGADTWDIEGELAFGVASCCCERGTLPTDRLAAALLRVLLSLFAGCCPAAVLVTGGGGVDESSSRGRLVGWRGGHCGSSLTAPPLSDCFHIQETQGSGCQHEFSLEGMLANQNVAGYQMMKGREGMMR